MRGSHVIIALFLAILLLVPIVVGGRWGPERVLFALFLEGALLAIAAPIRMEGRVFLTLLGTGAAAAVGLALLFAPQQIGTTLLAQLVLAGYGGFLRSLAIVLSRPAGPRAAQLAGTVVGIALLVSPFGIDHLLDLAGPGACGSYLLRGSLVLCPPASISHSLFDLDWVREGSLYTRARFVSSRPFTSPRWFEAVAAFLVLWASLTALARVSHGVSSRGGANGGGYKECD